MIELRLSESTLQDSFEDTNTFLPTSSDRGPQKGAGVSAGREKEGLVCLPMFTAEFVTVPAFPSCT
jgi:hypothetical protein